MDFSFDPERVTVPQGSHVAGARRIGGGAELPVRRPSDGRVACVFREADAQDVDAAVTAAFEAFSSTGWARGEPRRRGAVLRRWADLVEAHAEELARLESLVSSRPVAEVRGRDVPVTAEIIRFYGEYADKAHGEVLASRSDILSLTDPEPYGVVAAISPWNVPMVLAAAKVAPALAAGNAVVLKPSELTPLSMLRVAELAVEAGLPAGLLNVVVGTGAVTGTALVRHPLVRYISFTGSTATGAHIMAEAARHGLKPVSLELGGKSPQIVFADAPDLDAVADVVAAGLTRNSGQICFCGSRLVVERPVLDPLIDKVAARIGKVVSGPTWKHGTSLPPIISAAQAERIEGILGRALDQGAEAVAGGRRFREGGADFFEPTIVVDAGAGNPVLEEEVFGPVLAVQVFDDPEEAVRLADHPVYGLAAGIHTADIDRAVGTARRIDAGTVWVNTYGRGMDVSSPFGGTKQSGFGKDFGLPGFEKYMRKKSIWIQTR